MRTPESCNVVRIRVNDKSYLALIDSGAVVSLVKLEIAKGFKKEKCNVNLVDIQDNTIPVRGMATIPVMFEGDIVVRHNFIVVNTDSLRADLLLGIDFLRQYGIKVDWQNNCMYAFDKQIQMYDENIDAEYAIQKGEKELMNKVRNLEIELDELKTYVKNLERNGNRANMENAEKSKTHSNVKGPTSLPMTEDHGFTAMGSRFKTGSEQCIQSQNTVMTSSRNLASSREIHRSIPLRQNEVIRGPVKDEILLFPIEKNFNEGPVKDEILLFPLDKNSNEGPVRDEILLGEDFPASLGY